VWGPTNHCAYRPGQVVLARTLSNTRLAAVNAQLATLGFGTLARTPDPTVGGDKQATLYSLSSGDPLHAADIVTGMGFEAQPNFAVGMTPNWAYSPGSDATPAPGYVSTPVRNAPSPSTVVGVVDTGFDGASWPAGWARPVTVYGPSGDVNRGPVGGHGTFIAALIHQVAPNVNIITSKPAGLDMDTDPATGRAYPIVDDFGVGKAVDVLNRRGADILSLSFGTYACSDVASTRNGAPRTSGPIATRQAMLYFRRVDATRIVVAAAGNDAHGPNDPTMYPSGFATRSWFTGGVLGSVSDWVVSAGTNASFSNHGNSVEVSATGVDVVSYRPTVDTQAAGPYYWSGTSFATPCVAATIAAQVATSGVSPVEQWITQAGQIGVRVGRFASDIEHQPIDIACNVKF
jgi:Subtilase family